MRLPASFLLLLLAACGGSMDMSGAQDLGVTPGGSQDIAYAREIIEAGGIPRREHFTAEGLFSEHDLPLAGDGACDAILCPAAAATPFSPIDGSGPQALVQLGFDTVLDAETFERRPLALAVAVDVSGSMADGKLDAVKDALHVMVDQLDERDQVALVAFDNTSWTELSLTTMDAEGRAALDAAIRDLEELGGTNIEAGLREAYDHVEPTAGTEGVETRVMLFTDAQPNVGDTGVNSFLGLVGDHAELGIGISVFGVGLDMGTELADAISKTRGGNYFYLATQDDIRQVFDEEFDYIVTPLAYDLAVEVTPASGVSLYAGWGAVLDEGADRLDIGATTLFLSARDGGMGVSLVGDAIRDMAPGTTLATFDLAYEELDGTAVADSVTVRWDGGATLGTASTLADDVGVYKMAGLVDEFLALTAGADFCSEDLPADDAAARIEAAAAHLAEIAAALPDDGMAAEDALMRKLLTNLADDGRDACAIGDTYAY